MQGLTEVIGVEMWGKHGVLESEKTNPQRFVVDVRFVSDFTRAVDSDSIEDTVSYCDVVDVIRQHVEGPHLDLIETLGARICEDVLSIPGVEGAEVKVKKPDAPIAETRFAYAAVTVSGGAPC